MGKKYRRIIFRRLDDTLANVRMLHADNIKLDGLINLLLKIDIDNWKIEMPEAFHFVHTTRKGKGSLGHIFKRK